MSPSSSPHHTLTQPVRLKTGDADRFLQLRRKQRVTDPWAFDADPEDGEAGDLDWAAGLLTREDTVAIFAVEHPQDSRQLIASAAVTRARQPRYAHRARVWGVYVDPAFRGHGLGRSVMQAVIRHARTWQGVDYLDLSVSANSPAALNLYTRLGFIQWGREPETTACGEQRFDEIYMTLRL